MMPRNQSVIPLLVFLLVFFTSSSAVGEPIELQPGPEEGIDTHIINVMDVDLGTSHVMSVEYGDQYPQVYVFSLVKFDLPDSLSVENLESAQLKLYAYLVNTGGTAEAKVNVHRILQTWEESSVWSSLMGGYPPEQTFFDPSVVSFFSATAPGWMSFDVTNLVRDWISNPSSNYGVLLETPDSEVPTNGDKGVNMYTSDWLNISGQSDNLPKLVINYSETEPATIDFHPDTLNLKSRGRWVTCYMELPEGNDLEDIDISSIAIVSIKINGGEANEIEIPAELYPVEVGDYDGDGIPDLMVKFDRESVQEAASSGGVAEITVSCETYVNGTTFEGSDTVLIINKGQEHYSEDHGSVVY